MRLPTDLSSRYEYHSGRTQGTTTLPTHIMPGCVTKSTEARWSRARAHSANVSNSPFCRSLLSLLLRGEDWDTKFRVHLLRVGRAGLTLG
jgi:hypothetical protein